MERRKLTLMILTWTTLCLKAWFLIQICATQLKVAYICIQCSESRSPSMKLIMRITPVIIVTEMHKVFWSPYSLLIQWLETSSMGNRTLPCLSQGREFMFNESAVHAYKRKEEKAREGKKRKGKWMERKGREGNRKSDLFKPSLKMDCLRPKNSSSPSKS